MATRRQTVNRKRPLEHDPPAGREVASIEPPDDDAPDGLAAALSTLGGHAGEVFVYRRNDAGKWAYCFSVAPEHFSVDQVAERFGGGMYRVRVKESGTGHFKGSHVFDIEGPSKGHSTVAPGPAAGVVELQQQIQELSRQMRDLVAAKTAPAQTDPMALALQMSQVAATQMTTLVTLFEQLRPKTPESVSDSAQLIEMLKSGIDLGRRLGRLASGEPERAGPSALELYLPKVFELFDSVKNGRAAAPVTDQNSETQPQPGAEPVPIPIGWQAIAPHVERLIPKAQNNGDPGLWAGVLEEDHPAMVRALERLVEQYGETAVLQEFFANFPKAEPYRNWFVSLFQNLVAHEVETDSE